MFGFIFSNPFISGVCELFEPPSSTHILRWSVTPWTFFFEIHYSCIQHRFLNHLRKTRRRRHLYTTKVATCSATSSLVVTTFSAVIVIIAVRISIIHYSCSGLKSVWNRWYWIRPLSLLRPLDHVRTLFRASKANAGVSSLLRSFFSWSKSFNLVTASSNEYFS